MCVVTQMTLHGRVAAGSQERRGRDVGMGCERRGKAHRCRVCQAGTAHLKWPLGLALTIAPVPPACRSHSAEKTHAGKRQVNGRSDMIPSRRDGASSAASGACHRRKIEGQVMEGGTDERERERERERLRWRWAGTVDLERPPGHRKRRVGKSRACHGERPEVGGMGAPPTPCQRGLLREPSPC